MRSAAVMHAHGPPSLVVVGRLTGQVDELLSLLGRHFKPGQLLVMKHIASNHEQLCRKQCSMAHADEVQLLDTIPDPPKGCPHHCVDCLKCCRSERS